MNDNNYKDSNILFVGKIPSNWIVRSMRSLFTFGRGRVISNEEIADNKGEYPVYSSQTKNDGILGYIDTYDFSGEYVTWTTDGANAGTVFYREGKFNCTNVCGTIQPKKEGIVYLKLLPYYLNFATKEYVRYDINPKLMNNVMGDIPICFPESLKLQKQMVNYLDKQTAKIDATIAKNEELLQLLEEKRVALINQVVTKGLNPNVPMKDSGVEWIGEIPEHWGVEKIKNLSQVKPSHVDKKTKDNEPPVLLCNYTDVYNNEFITMDLDFMKATATYDQIKKLSLNVGDIIITKDSESADDIAVPAIVTEKLENVVCGYHLAVIRPNEEKIYPKFLFRSFESDKINKQFEHGANGVTRFGLGTYPINNAYVCQPPLSEQKEIANYLDNENSKIYKATNKIMVHTDLLEEYKTSLIHNVVTGKIDVREDMV